MEKIHFSIILTTKRKIQNLKSLFVNTDLQTEIVIADSEYNKETLEWLKKQNGYERIVYIPIKKSSFQYYRDFSQGLNTALSFSENGWIIRADDNLEFKEDFFDKCRDNIESFKDSLGHEHFAIIGQKLWGELNHIKWNDYFDSKMPSRYISIRNPLFTFSFGLYPIDLIHKLNGYDERYDEGFGYDDINFLHRTLLLGYQVFFDRHLMAYSLPHKPNKKNIEITKMLYSMEQSELQCGKMRAFNQFDFVQLQNMNLNAKKQYIV